MDGEKQHFWDLSCKAAKSSDLENLFGIQLTIIKLGGVRSPRVNWGITKGPRIPEELKRYVAEIDVHKIYGR